MGQVFGPGGFLRVTDEATQLMNDEFDTLGSLDTVNNWLPPVSGNGAVAASTASGSLSLATGTTANGYSYVQSRPSFRGSTPAWIRFAFNITLADSAAPIANSYRYWGSGSPNGTPTVAAPILNGAGFEMTTTGHLCAVVYNNGTRALIADLYGSYQPMDALTHNYAIFYRPTKIYWYLDDPDNACAVSTLAQSALNVDTLPAMYMAVGGPTPPASSAAVSSNAQSVADTGKNNVKISDGTYSYRTLTVYGTGGVAAAPVDGGRATYSTAVAGMSTINAGDVFTVTGSASKTIRITGVTVTCAR